MDGHWLTGRQVLDEFAGATLGIQKLLAAHAPGAIHDDRYA
jgi:hypothetical protein